MAGKIFPINTLPGVRRDGTPYAGNYYIDSQHCRWQRGLPQKMGGYEEMINDLPFPSRGVYVNPAVSRGQYALFTGDRNSLYEYFFTNGNITGARSDRTPQNFRQDPNNMWTFDVLYSGGRSYIFAHAAPNLADINSQIQTPVYHGLLSSGGIDNVDALTPINYAVSGGLIALHPFLLLYDNNGIVQWSDETDPTVMIAQEPICSQKIVTALQTRAGNASPGALFWSLDSLIRCYFNPIAGAPINFDFDTITDQTSILSQNSAIEYDGLYFWAAVDRFCVYNGTSIEVPNDMNINYFYDNLNYDARQKVWVTKYPRKGEILWFYPSGNNTECDRVLIYNKRENKWYDTALARSAGYFEQIYPFPLWATNTPNGGGNYSIYTHETGTDQILFDGTKLPIQSYFETGDISFCAQGPAGSWTGVNRWVSLEQLEPDFIQTGNLTLTVQGREYSRGNVTVSDPIIITPNTEKVNPRVQKRHMTLRFESNELGGYYEMGQPLLTLSIGDARS